MFCSSLDVRNALTPGAASQSVATAANLSDDQIDDAIRQADARIQGYVPTDYTVGMVVAEGSVDLMVAVAPFRYWSRDIAAYLATLTFKRNQDVPVDEPVRLRYQAAIDDLMAVAKGLFVLPPDANADDNVEAGEVVVHNQYTGNLFGPSDFDLAYGRPYESVYHRRILDGE